MSCLSCNLDNSKSGIDGMMGAGEARMTPWYFGQAWVLFLGVAMIAPFAAWMILGKYGVFKDENERNDWLKAGVIGGMVLSYLLVLTVI